MFRFWSALDTRVNHFLDLTTTLYLTVTEEYTEIITAKLYKIQIVMSLDGSSGDQAV